jgi:SET domain-containing protein
MNAAVYVALCEFGNGVFANRAFMAGEEILVLEGRNISFAETQERGEAESHPVQIGADCYIDVSAPAKFLNHSCNPNAGLIHDRVLVALRDIRGREEIRFDYSTTMEENSWVMTCRCGDPHCRGTVTDFRLLPSSTKQDYIRRGIVQKFIRETCHSSIASSPK